MPAHMLNMLKILLTAVYMQKKKKNNFGNTDAIFAQFLLAAGVQCSGGK